MTDRLTAVDAFIERNQSEAHQHVEPSEARAFYAASVDGDIGGERSLAGQKIMLGCVVCSAMIAEIQPGASPVGRNVVIE